MSNAAKDLRKCVSLIGKYYPVTGDVCMQAADYIERLEAENQRLKQDLCTLWAYEERDMSVVLGGGEWLGVTVKSN